MNSDRYRVMRQDDNGNKYVVATNLSKDEAEDLVKRYEAKGHKQHYWAEPC